MLQQALRDIPAHAGNSFDSPDETRLRDLVAKTTDLIQEWNRNEEQRQRLEQRLEIMKQEVETLRKKLEAS